MSLDTKKPYGTICGYFAECPTARYEQAGKFFNIFKEEIQIGEPDLATIPQAPTVPVEVEIKALAKKLEIAKKAAKEKPTPARRKTVTQLENQLAKLQE